MAAALFSEKEQPIADTEQPLAASPPPLAYSSRAWSCPWSCPVVVSERKATACFGDEKTPYQPQRHQRMNDVARGRGRRRSTIRHGGMKERTTSHTSDDQQRTAKLKPKRPRSAPAKEHTGE